MAGLGLAWPGHPRGSGESLVKIVPGRIGGEDQPHLPGARRQCFRFLPLNGSADIVMVLDVDQPPEIVPSGEAVGHPRGVPRPGGQDQDRWSHRHQRTVRPVRHDVDPTAMHTAFISSAGAGLQLVDGRDKPGHDAKDRTSLRLGGPNRNPRALRDHRFVPLFFASWTSADRVASRQRLSYSRMAGPRQMRKQRGRKANAQDACHGVKEQ